MDFIVVVIGGTLLNSRRVLATSFKFQSYRQLSSQTYDQVIVDQYTICRRLPMLSRKVVPKCNEQSHLLLPDIIGEPLQQLHEGCTSIALKGAT
jgi:hypothetical protein